MESGPPFSLADDDIIYLWVLLRITCDNVCKELGHSPPTVTYFSSALMRWEMSDLFR